MLQLLLLLKKKSNSMAVLKNSCAVVRIIVISRKSKRGEEKALKQDSKFTFAAVPEPNQLLCFSCTRIDAQTQENKRRKLNQEIKKRNGWREVGGACEGTGKLSLND